MNIERKILPSICLMAAYVHWIKPRLLSASASKGGKSLLLHLCARSRFLIPMIVFTAFCIFDAQMQVGVSISLTLSRNVRITLGPDGAQPGVDEYDADDEDDGTGTGDDETYTISSFSSNSSASDLSQLAADDVETALQEFVGDSDGRI